MHFLQACVIHVRVDLRCGDAGVAEHFLHLPKIRSPGQQVRGKTVSQRVGADFARHADAGRVFFYQFPDAFSSQARATR